MCAWDHLIPIPIGTLGCEEHNTVLFFGGFGKKAARGSYIGVPTAMRKHWFPALRYVPGLMVVYHLKTPFLWVLKYYVCF